MGASLGFIAWCCAFPRPASESQRADGVVVPGSGRPGRHPSTIAAEWSAMMGVPLGSIESLCAFFPTHTTTPRGPTPSPPQFTPAGAPALPRPRLQPPAALMLAVDLDSAT